MLPALAHGGAQHEKKALWSCVCFERFSSGTICAGLWNLWQLDFRSYGMPVDFLGSIIITTCSASKSFTIRLGQRSADNMLL